MIKFVGTDQIEVTLETKIKRGDMVTNKIIINKPKVRSLGNVSQTELLHQNPKALAKVLPRITEPMLAEKEYLSMPLSDSNLLGTAVSLFFMSAGIRAKVMEDLREAYGEEDLEEEVEVVPPEPEPAKKVKA